jgi:hypothetical protein
MASAISLKDQFLYVSNKRLSTLIAFALQVGDETAHSDAERDWVKNLLRFEEGVWPGIEFDLDKQFPDVEEKKFWARVYVDVSHRIFLRQLGNHDVTFWQSSAIGDAYVIARLLTRAVQEAVGVWHPDTENTREGDALYTGEINIRV